MWICFLFKVLVFWASWTVWVLWVTSFCFFTVDMQINIGLKYPLNKVSYLLYLIKMKKWFTVLTLFCISLGTYRMVFDHLSVLSLSVDRKNDRKSHFSSEKLTQCANTFLIHCKYERMITLSELYTSATCTGGCTEGELGTIPLPKLKRKKKKIVKIVWALWLWWWRKCAKQFPPKSSAPKIFA